MDNTNELDQTTVVENTSASDSSTVETEIDPYVEKLAPIYQKATAACSKMMAPIHEMNEYVDKKNELDVQYKDQLEAEDYTNAVKELQTGYFGDDAIKINIANKFEKVHDFADTYGISSVGAAIGTVAGKMKDVFAQTSVGQKLEDIKVAAAEIENPETGDTATASAETTDTKSNDSVTTSADVTNVPASAAASGAAVSAMKAAQASSFFGIADMEGSEAESDFELKS